MGRVCLPQSPVSAMLLFTGELKQLVFNETRCYETSLCQFNEMLKFDQYQGETQYYAKAWTALTKLQVANLIEKETNTSLFFLTNTLKKYILSVCSLLSKKFSMLFY